MSTKSFVSSKGKSPTLSELANAKRVKQEANSVNSKQESNDNFADITGETESKSNNHSSNYSSSYINDQASELSVENVRVVCRFRPINKKERHEEKSQRLVDLPIEYSKDGESVIIKREQYKNNLEFSLDRILQSSTTQDEAFRLLGQPLVEQVMTGYNCTIFAYGQTGSGRFILFIFIYFSCLV